MDEYDFKIGKLQELREEIEEIIKKWENSEFRYTEYGQTMVETCESIIQDIDEEIAMYTQAKTTGVVITKEGRDMLKKFAEDKKQNIGTEPER